MKPLIQTPTTLITGFLGAGKTTLINTLLMHKSPTQKWALLINEFGKIGIDTGLITHQDNVFIKEVSGGCICCSGQLPMQVAMVRLLAHKPNRLVIEPTGLSHAKELLEQFSAAHWQSSLKLAKVICVVNVLQWQQSKYRQHLAYQAHVKYADVIVINHHQTLTSVQELELRAWIEAINPNAKIMYFDAIPQHIDQLLADRLSSLSGLVKLTPSLMMGVDDESDGLDDDILPYHYHDELDGYVIGGWHLPSAWVFDEYALQKWLLELPNYERIKGVLHVGSGWITINITPCNVTISSGSPQISNKLEMIFAKQTWCGDWQLWDKQLMAIKME